jgi:uncharacterized protein
MRLLALSALFLAVQLAPGPLVWAKDVPPPPPYGVLDEPAVLTPAGKQALETLLTEHERLSGEQLVIAIFNDLEGEDAVTFSQRVFKGWGVGLRGKSNGLLLALYWKNQKARLEVGFGLELALPEGKPEDVLEEFLVPELRRSEPYRGLSLATLEILRLLESPLVADGKAQKILSDGGFRGEWQPAARAAAAAGADPGTNSSGWIVLGVMIAGIALALAALNRVVNAGIHYTAKGWFREPLKLSLFKGRGRVTPAAGGASGSW